MQKKIGIFGGSFDPIHNGHIALAREALTAMPLDTVVFVPAHIPPHKSTLCASVKDRLYMLTRALKPYKYFSISQYEISKEKPVYTREIIEYFINRFSQSEVFFIIGEDSLRDMHGWEGGYELLDQCTFIVGLRPKVSFKSKAITQKVIMLNTMMPNVSATDIRKKLRAHTSIKGLLPEPIRRYIIQKHLYIAHNSKARISHEK